MHIDEVNDWLNEFVKQYQRFEILHYYDWFLSNVTVQWLIISRWWY